MITEMLKDLKISSSTAWQCISMPSTFYETTAKNVPLVSLDIRYFIASVTFFCVIHYHLQLSCYFYCVQMMISHVYPAGLRMESTPGTRQL
jgi:hypothetical protein